MPTTLEIPDLIPARMLNEFAYCPRLAYLEWVQGDFADSADTVDGRHQHRRVDKESGDLPPADQLPSQDGDVLHARSVYLSAPKAGLVARIDLVEAGGAEVVPIDYKRGEAPDIPEGAWEPERVQVCAQGLVLEENGYTCQEGIIYFVALRKRVAVPFTDELRARTVELAARMREVMVAEVIPAPLVDSPKCPGARCAGSACPTRSTCWPGPHGEECDLPRLNRAGCWLPGTMRYRCTCRVLARAWGRAAKSSSSPHARGRKKRLGLARHPRFPCSAKCKSQRKRWKQR